MRLRSSTRTPSKSFTRALPAAASAACTTGAVIGSSLNRTPIASLTALATAADTGMTPDSPRPLAPNGPSASPVSIRRTTISGMSSALRIA